MESLTRREEQIMLAILYLKENAYLVSIRKYLTKLMNKPWSIGAVHIPLRRLEKVGLIESSFGESTAVRGGRKKKIYHISKKGMIALSENKRISDQLWNQFPEFGIK
jgi:DNA-binding PadR family transcriptional regulator